MADPVRTLCPYCGVGCGLLATADASGAITVRGDPDHPANFGKICLKGATVGLTVNVPNRLRYCMLADIPGKPRVVPAATAVGFAAQKLTHIIQQHGPTAVGFYLSGQMTTEAQYFFNKLAKGFLRTNHVDSNSRLCMSSAASGMTLSLGSDGPPVCYADIELADAFFFIGSNAADCHPITFDRVRRRMKRKHAPCIVADPRKTATAEAATLHLPLRPGTDLALLNGILRQLRDWDCLDNRFIADHTDGFAELSAMLEDYPAAKVADICGISQDDFTAACRIIADHERLLSFWTMGINQTVQGTFASNAIINLHLATGRIGKPGAGPFSLTGQPNAMGGRDVGYMSHLLPGQRKIIDADARAEMEQIWQLPPGTINAHPGHDAVGLIDALDRGEVRALWIVGSNPAASFPNLPKVRRALERADLVIVQDAYFPTETTRFAHVILPAAVNLEQSGVFCNSERRVSLMQQVTSPPGDAQPDWVWGHRIAAAMGFGNGLQYDSAADIFAEFARSTAGRPNDQSTLTHESLAQAGPTQWPAPQTKPSSRRRFTDKVFATANGKAKLLARPYLPPEEMPTAQFPLVLTTGRLHSQWHTRTKTGNVRQLNDLCLEPRVEIHPHDAAELDLHDGQLVEIRSKRGSAVGKVAVTEETQAGVVFMPMHWNDLWSPRASPNEATNDDVDVLSKQPSLKACAVKLSPLG